MTDYPPVEELLPHRGTMLLLDRITEFAGQSLVAECSPRSHTWYADDSGAMPAWIGVELMAQAIAAHVALTKRQSGLPQKMGALLGTRRYQVTPSVGGRFSGGSLLQIRVQETFRDESGLAAYDCAIERSGESLVSSTLKVYEPDDFGSFLQGGTQ